MTALSLRIRDTELSVRTANALCSAYGEDVTWQHFFDPCPPDTELVRHLGRKGLKEFHEMRDCVWTLAHPPHGGSGLSKSAILTLRDQFAMASLQGFRANSDLDQDAPSASFAEWAYEDADAMMEARK